MNKGIPLEVVLFEPRIPQNTGNIARTCAAFKIPLVLIEPLGFSLEDKFLKRAGLDYWKYVDLSTYKNIYDYIERINYRFRLIGISSFGGNHIDSFNFLLGDKLLFGREDTGLPIYVRNLCHEISTIPMSCSAKETPNKGVRSLNLSVACGITTFIASSKLDLL